MNSTVKIKQITGICNNSYSYLHNCFIDVFKHATKHNCRNKTIYCFIEVFKHATKHECLNKIIYCFFDDMNAVTDYIISSIY